MEDAGRGRAVRAHQDGRSSTSLDPAEYRFPPRRASRRAIALRRSDRRHFEGERETIVRLAQLASLTLDGAPTPGEGAHAVFGDGSEVAVGTHRRHRRQQNASGWLRKTRDWQN